MFKEMQPNIDESQHQPNTVDFTCDIVYAAKFSFENGCAVIRKDKTVPGEYININPYNYPALNEGKPNEDGRKGWYFEATQTYQTFTYNNVIIPDGHIGIIFTRSSLNRNGAFLAPGALYDSGYEGPICSTLYVLNPNGIFIEHGARIGSFALIKAETHHKYNGQYQTQKAA